MDPLVIIIAVMFPYFLLCGSIILHIWQNKVIGSTLVDMGRSLVDAVNITRNPTSGIIHEQMQGRIELEKQKRLAQDIIQTKQRLNVESVKQAAAPPRRVITLRPADRPPISGHLSIKTETTGTPGKSEI